MDTNLEPHPQNTGPVAPPATPEQRQALAAGHETTDVNVTGLFIFGGALLVAILVSFVGVAILFKGFGVLDHYLDKKRAQGEPGANSLVRTAPDYQGPLLQALPEMELHALQSQNAADLRGYGWVNRDQGVVRVPIDRAMELVAQRGLPPVSPGLTVEAIQRQRADPQVYGQNLRP